MTSVLPAGVSGEEVLAAIDRIRPVVEHHRDEAERQRRLSDEVIAAMESEGLFKLWLPREYGGVELDLPAYLEAIEALSRIDAAAGWMLAIIGTGGVQAAFLPEAGAREIYGSGALTAGSVQPRGRATPVEGGYRLNGRWSLASGCEQAEWLGCNAIVFDGETPRMGEGGMPDFKLMFYRREDCAILDTWFATGMRGTGSTDIVVEDVFIPEHRSFSLFTAPSHVSGSLYRMRLEMHFLTALSTVALGIARDAIDAFVEVAKGKTPTLSQTGLAERPVVHAAVARAEAQYQAARAYLHEVARDMTEAVSAGSGVPEDIEARRRLACNYAADACESVVDTMYRLAGVSAIYSGHRLDRCLRDVHTVNQHLAVSPVWWEKTGQWYFGFGLGMP